MDHSQPSGTDEELTTLLTVTFPGAARALGAAGSADETARLVVRLAVTIVEGCDFAGLSISDGDEVTTVGYTDPIVVGLDAQQRRTGEGPGLAALVGNVSVYAEDLRGDSRWPSFGLEADGRGIRSVLALPLLAGAGPGTLDLYARYPQAFGVIDRARGVLLAAIAGLALGAARVHEADERRSANLRGALESRAIISQAQGILIERERITPAEAFDILRQASQHLNVKLREVARTLVETGENPETGSVGP